jgi:anti-sigma regulatory factor (Ser/Thr protein kinase)
VLEVVLPVTGAARRARDVVTQACVQWDLPRLVGPASLVVTELVSNVVQHAWTMADVRVVRGRRYLMILVHDGSSIAAVMPPRSVLSERAARPDLSRGLLLVDVTADRWGVLAG